MKIITANIPLDYCRHCPEDSEDRKTVVIRLFHLSPRPRLLTAPVCPVSEVSLDGVWDGQWRYYFNSWRQLSANWLPSPSVPCVHFLSNVIRDAWIKTFSAVVSWEGDHPGISVTAHLLHKHTPNEHIMMVVTQISSDPCLLSDVTLHVLSGVRGAGSCH